MYEKILLREQVRQGLESAETFPCAPSMTPSRFYKWKRDFTVDFTKLLPKYSKFRPKVGKSIVKFKVYIENHKPVFETKHLIGLFQLMGQSGLCLQTGL